MKFHNKRMTIVNILQVIMFKVVTHTARQRPKRFLERRNKIGGHSTFGVTTLRSADAFPRTSRPDQPLARHVGLSSNQRGLRNLENSYFSGYEAEGRNPYIPSSERCYPKTHDV